MAILGLVVQQPDTVASVGLRLTETFPHARWSRNAAHGNLPSLAKQGLVRLVGKGVEPSLDRYEATVDGVAHFRGWVRASVAVPPALRDTLQGKLKFVEEDELVALIETVREVEAAHASEYAAAHGRLRAARRLARRGGAAATDITAKLRTIQMADEMTLWGVMAHRVGRLGNELEELHEEIHRPARGRDVGDE
jgi:hypothetical protein